MSKGTVMSVDSSTVTSERGSLGCDVEVMMWFAFSLMGGREGDEGLDSERGSKEAIDVGVPIERRCCLIGCGHFL